MALNATAIEVRAKTIIAELKTKVSGNTLLTQEVIDELTRQLRDQEGLVYISDDDYYVPEEQ